LKRVVISMLRRLSALWPRAGVRGAHAFAALTRPFARGIAEERLAVLFPDLSAAERRMARQRTWANFLMGEAIDAARSRRGSTGAAWAAPRPELSALRPPLVLAFFHVGPWQALGDVSSPLPAETITIFRSESDRDFPATLLAVRDTSWERAGTFHRALVALRSGSSVLINLDAFHPDKFAVSTIDVPLFDRRFSLARGAFALARMSRVPIVPLAARWRGTAIDVTVGEPIPPDLAEGEMAAAAASWIEGYLRDAPGETSVFILERLQPPLTR
jgi:lauroyl/myristoyl acyltransferase